MVNSLATRPLFNEEHILDAPFTLDELCGAIRKLKPGIANDPDVYLLII